MGVDTRTGEATGMAQWLTARITLPGARGQFPAPISSDSQLPAVSAPGDLTALVSTDTSTCTYVHMRVHKHT